MGLGALWSGLAKWALTKVAPEIVHRLGVPESSHRSGGFPHSEVITRPMDGGRLAVVTVNCDEKECAPHVHTTPGH